MNTQVITISQDGGMSGLQRKTGKGVDLRQFGRASIERASLIEWDENKQKWWVSIQSGKYAGAALSHVLRCNAGMMPATGEAFYPGSTMTTNGGVYMFKDYDDAVKAEVAFLDALRLRGVF